MVFKNICDQLSNQLLYIQNACFHSYFKGKIQSLHILSTQNNSQPERAANE